MTTLTSDPTREILATRLLRAPRDLVLRMWSNPALISKWWGPFGFTTTTHEMNFEPGGTWRFTMHGPDGVDYENLIKYIEVGPDVIEYDHSDADGLINFHVFVTLKAVAPNQTEMTFKSVFPTAEARRTVVEEHGAEVGLQNTVSRLDTLLMEMLSETDPFTLHISLPSDTEILITRSVRAPKGLVCETFLKPEHMERWWGPYSHATPVFQIDARVGGKWSAVSPAGDPNPYTFQGVFLEIVPGERISQTFQYMDYPPMTQTATFKERDNVTRITVHCKFDSIESRDGMMQGGNMEWGMNQSYERLETLVMEVHEPEFQFTRTFKAPAELVWRAWTEADRFEKWFGSPNATVKVKSMDFQPGGSMHYVMSLGEQKVYGRFDYREISPIDRFVYINAFADENGDYGRNPWMPEWPVTVLNTVAFSESAGETTIVLSAWPITDKPTEMEAFKSSRKGMEYGFKGTLDALEKYLGETV